MSKFRCNQCGREYEGIPAACLCGNSNPAMWTPAGSVPPQPANNDWQQPVNNVPPQPANNGWQQPQNGAWQQPVNSGWQQPAYGTPQSPAPQQQTGGGKKKNTALIAVILAVVLIGLGVGGYFLWQHFSGDDASSSQDGDEDKEKEKDKDDDKDKDKDKDKNQDTEKNNAGDDDDDADDDDDDDADDDADADDDDDDADDDADADDEDEDANGNNGTQPADADNQASFLGVTVTIPDGFVMSASGDDYHTYYSADDSTYFYIEKDEYDGEYSSLKEYIEAKCSQMSDTDVGDITERTIGGHSAVSVHMAHTGGTEAVDYVFIEFNGYNVLVGYYYNNYESITDHAKFKASLNSITVQ